MREVYWNYLADFADLTMPLTGKPNKLEFFGGSALEQQWLGSGSLDWEGLRRHNILNTCLNGASEVCIGIYVKH